MTDNQLLGILTKALREYAPKAYRKMAASGELNAFLENLMGVTLEAISAARQQEIASMVTQGSPQFEADPLKRTQQINMATKTAEELAIAQAVETIMALPAEPHKHDAA
ncbi:hypothetical protein [Paraburkholderia sacchari]|uniref:hypothetical protein n=1 Tax=Paraburkholderia sacchari TaxID=159450 RepID=UPI000543EE23|nr:hypothetical protein [Paraburkholderia sacchari]NLP64209.1 hypothetical protein [Paraburkholderia sacchari]